MKTVRVKFMDKEAACTALFDIGSGYTVIQRSFFEENFGANWSKLLRTIKARARSNVINALNPNPSKTIDRESSWLINHLLKLRSI